MDSVRAALSRELEKLKKQPIDSLLASRYQKLMSFGEFTQ